jgi:hypothetical protein
MTTKIDQFTESLRHSLTAIASQLDTAKADLLGAQHADKVAILTKLQEARHFVESKKQQTKAAGTKMQAWITAKEEAGAAMIEAWKLKGERKRLESHAGRAEENASAAVLYASGAVADALVATYEALEARLAANEALPVQHSTGD